MSVDLTLVRTKGGPLTPVTFSQALAVLARVSGALGPRGPRATMRGQEIRLAVDLPLDDGACTGFLLDFAGQGARVRGTAHGPSAPALVWAFHTLAQTCKCRLSDTDSRLDIDIAPDAHRAAATTYLQAHDAEVLGDRRKGAGQEPDGQAFVAWLAREEHIALASPAGDVGQDLPLDDASAVYERLFDSDAVEDVFVSERELATLLARYRARTLQ
jgi:hypothetical protein